jgi:transcriptional regulator with XRE-family HTH domain
MPRPSKAAHVLAKLRDELGLHQKELAERVGLHWRTIQDVERGKTQLSRRNAMRISEKTGVSVNWLLANDPTREMVSVSGEPWSNQDRVTAARRAERFPRIARLTRKLQATVSGRLLYEYFELRTLIEAMPNPLAALLAWHEIRKRALEEFMKKFPEAKEIRPDRFNPESIKGDVDIVIEEEANWTERDTETLPILIALSAYVDGGWGTLMKEGEKTGWVPASGETGRQVDAVLADLRQTLRAAKESRKSDHPKE